MAADRQEVESVVMTILWSVRPSRKRVLSIVKVFAALLVVGPFVVHAMPWIVGASQSYVVLSDSMAPAIESGDIIIVDTVDPATIREGDIITFRETPTDERPTTHRVVGVTRSEGGLVFRTKGDANEDPDQEPVSAGQILGEVVFVIPYLGYVVRFANTTYGFVVFVALPLGLLIVSEIWSLIKTTRTPGDRINSEDTAIVDIINTSTAKENTLREIDSSLNETSTEGADESTDTSGFTLTTADLRLTVGVLSVFTAYSVWVAYNELTAWSVTVAVAATGAFLLVVGLVLFGGDISNDVPTEPVPTDNDRDSTVTSYIVTAPVAPERHPAPMVPVDSLESLIDTAITNEQYVIKDPNDQTYFLPDEDVVYKYNPNDTYRSISGGVDTFEENTANDDRWNWIEDRHENGGSDGSDGP